MRAMVSSVKDKGVTQPAIVRPREDGGYEIVSGHRRQKASELAGYADIPCTVHNLTDDEAITKMVEGNLNQREEIPQRYDLIEKSNSKISKLNQLIDWN